MVKMEVELKIFLWSQGAKGRSIGLDTVAIIVDLAEIISPDP
jgi:hypothetical protein